MTPPPSAPRPEATAEPEAASHDREKPPLPKWAKTLSWFLDDMVQTPGGKFGVGADGIVGLLLPAAGDAITGAGSIALLVLALREGVPTVMIGRMVFNIAIDFLLGIIPLAGDAFDILWRANRRNYEIIEKHRNPDAEPTTLDYVIVIGGFVVSLLILATPFVFFLLYAAAVASLAKSIFG